MKTNVHTPICILLYLALWLPACGEDPTAVVVEIFAETGVEILIPTEVNQLKISVEVGEEEVWMDIFPLHYDPPRPLEESITFRPGNKADDAIRVVVVGTLEGDARASGNADGKFINTKIQYANVAMTWIPGVCIDNDEDAHGKGSCVGTDCDDTDPAVNSSAREDCNDVDDDCDGDTDNVPEMDKPRCQHYKGVCAVARKTCEAGEWLDCETAGYGPDWEPVETNCSDEFDNDCDGAINEGCVCSPGDERACAAPNKGECNSGIQHCLGPAVWEDTCEGAIDPRTEVCNQLDDDCDGDTDEDFDLLNDESHCGQCNNVCAAGLKCYGGQCLRGCDTGFYPTFNGTQAICISVLQEATTACEAFGNCAAMTDGGKVGYGEDYYTLPETLPGVNSVVPIVVWTEITQTCDPDCTYSARYTCIDDTPSAISGGTKACPDCDTTCINCTPRNCEEATCLNCGCSLRYWCYTENQ